MSEIVMIALILLPLFGGAACLFLPFLKDTGKRNIWVTVLLAAEAALALAVVVLPPQSLVLWKLIDNIGFTLFLDDLSRMFLVLFTVMWLLVGIYSLEYMEHEEHAERFYGFYLMTLASLVGIALSENLATLYLFYEFMSLLSLPLVLHNQTAEAKQAGLKYLFYSVAGAFLALGGMLLLDSGWNTGFGGSGNDGTVLGRVITSRLQFVNGGNPELYFDEGIYAWFLIAVLLLLIGFGTKAGMFPMQSWLPTAHPVAPAPASAVLSGVITKTGILAIIRVVFQIVGADALRGTWVQYTWLALSLITVFLGSMLAYKEKVLKKRLAFSTVSQVSYVMFGLATLHPLGVLGALMHVIFHSLVKNTLFMSAGAVIHHTGRTKVEELTGIGKQMPVTLWCFTLVSITLVGIPPTSAFVSKWYLANGALAGTLPAVFRYGGPAVLLVSALLTAGYLVTISMRGFLPGEDYDYTQGKKEAGLRMTVPMVLLTAVAVGIGMCMTPLLNFLQKIADSFFI